MAQALECPACGARHRLDDIPDSSSFRCSSCGQKLKAPTAAGSQARPQTPPSQVPPSQVPAPSQVRSQPDAPPPPARNRAAGTAVSSAAPAPASATAAGATAATAGAAPRTRSTGPANPSESGPTGTMPPTGAANGTSTARARSAPRPGARDAAAVSATVAATANGTTDAGRSGAPTGAPEDEPRRRGTRPASPAPKRTKVHWYWRVLAWVVAVPLGFLLTAGPAYKIGFLTKDDLLDVFVGTGTGRYTHLAVVTIAWALVTAILVQLLVEGGRAGANRRRRARAAAA
jgi:hypothetical protein